MAVRMKPVLEYRPDIDGLRAIAVLGVLLYHLGVPPFSGGFVGVDVFFVMSGYLISGIILSEAAAHRFSFADFYARRARRLLPALIATIAVSFIAAAMMCAPEDLERTGLSTAAALVGISNISFWQESGYFDVTGISKPLLHTWSLAVELQFYLVWPAFLVFLDRLGRAFVVSGVVATTVIGTVAGIWMIRVNPSAAFFLTPFRMNEFAAGALVACLAGPRSQSLGDGLFLGGMAAIAASLVLFSDLTRFPGYAVLLPVAGTSLVLYAAANARASAFLRSWPAVQIGRISYSLYLVHWPLIVFVQYVRDRPLTLPAQSMLIAATFVLAVISYRAVERPFRKAPLRADGWRNAAFYGGCAAAIGAVAAPALHAGLGNGWVWRFPGDLQAVNTVDVEEHRRYVWDNFNRLQTQGFRTARPHVLVIGDSQAADLVNMLLAAGFDRKAEIVTRPVFWECGMPFLPQDQRAAFWKEENGATIKNPSLIDTCEQQYREVAKPELIGSARYVVLAYYWQDNSLARIGPALRSLEGLTGARTVLVGAKAFDRSSIQMVNALGQIDGVEAFAADHVSPLSRRVNGFIGENFPGRFVDLLSAICPRPDFCRVLTDERRPIFFDFDHLTRSGAEYLGRKAAAELFAFLGRQ
jgi:peptidoglycan/LPS O-acetylase OafA/YrhL